MVTQSIPATYGSTTPVAIEWDDIPFDPEGMFDLGDPTRITIRTRGMYIINYLLIADEDFTAHVKVNGTIDIITPETSFPYILEVNDYIELILEPSVAPLTLAGPPERSPIFTAYRVG